MSKYELRTFSDTSTDLESSNMGQDGGCYVKTATGFLIGLVAILLSVGVGLIVHFAENRNLECVFPANINVGSLSGQEAQIQGAGLCPTSSVQQSTKSPDTHSSLATATTNLPSGTPPPAVKNVRLPNALLPVHYTLKLRPEMYTSDPEKFMFYGKVTIELNCTLPTRNVTLHIHALKIEENSITMQVKSGASSAPKYVKHTEDTERQFLIIELDRETTQGEVYLLSMDFSGPLKDDLQGLYLSSYIENNKTVYVATTQFEPTDARKAFPCFDEPAMKATFGVTLVRKKHLMSLSNMPLTNSSPIDNDYVEDVYETSRKMSTYLLAFIVGQFNKTENRTSKGLQYGAWSRPESVHETLFALDIGINTIVNYENYFGIDFPLPKQDMIAIPDFGLGAMENWGLITYRETAMLFFPGISSERYRQRVATVITHELAHQVLILNNP